MRAPQFFRIGSGHQIANRPLASPFTPQISFMWEGSFVASNNRSLSLRPSGLLAVLADQTKGNSAFGLRRLLTSQLADTGSPRYQWDMLRRQTENCAGGTSTRRVGGWRASFRVRWLVRRFRSGPQSGSHSRVSSPPLSEPGVRISRTGLSSGIMHLAHGPPERVVGEEPVGPATRGHCTAAILPPASFPVCRRACSRPGGVEPFGSDPFASACDAFRSLCPQGGVIG